MSVPMVNLDELLASFDPVSLEELDERAALLRRVDNKYAVPQSAFAELTRRLAGGHVVLEIGGRRMFAYRTTYFDTPELRCFTDHVEDRTPRFKVRTRLYEDSGECVFEMKLKRSDGETDKRQLKYRPDDHERLTEEAQECVRSALDDVGVSAPTDLGVTLTTAFDRVTLATTAGADRLTCDFSVRLIGPSENVASMQGELVLVETKSETGESPADSELQRMEFSPISLSKYRVGMATVGGAEGYGQQPGEELFQSGEAGR